MSTAPADSFNHVAARVRDFLDPAAPWYRSLWGPGVMLTVREILEASEAVHAGVLSQGALSYLKGTAMRLIGSDPGAGSEGQKRCLQESLRSELAFEGMEYRTVRQIWQDIESSYLDRWANVLRQPATCPGPERTARCIASYLLDTGLSLDFLHNWWKFNVRKKGAAALPKLVSAAHGISLGFPHDYRILIAFESIPSTKSGMPASWIDAPGVTAWLQSSGFEVRGLRQNGGVWLTVQARDPWAAVESAVERIDRMVARVAVARAGSLTPLSWAWIEGQRRRFPLRPGRRGVEVRALYRQDQLYSETLSSNVDAAIELLTPLTSSYPGAAVAGGWAAIEALLTAPGDKERVLAGDRMASLVACSYPRAELTHLSYKIEREVGGELACRLGSCNSNRDRARVLVGAIENRDPLPLSEECESAALARIRTLLAAPGKTLRDMEAYAAMAFRRLYRQRNMVLHWGRINSVALRASLRTAAPLVGAGMDRVAHAWFVKQTPPLELAARARIKLDTLESQDALACVDLLE